MELVKLINQLFFKEIGIYSLVASLRSALSLDENTAIEVAKDVAGMRLLVVSDWFNDEVAIYIKKLGGNPDNYRNYIEELKRAIKDEEELFKKEMAEDEPFELKSKNAALPERPLDPEQEKADSIEIFSGDLYTLLANGNNDYLGAYNIILLKLLAEDKSFKLEAEKAILSNQEQLSGKEFILDGKPAAPTIANWIKDFIKSEGSGMFDEMILSRYIVNSPNAKKLDEPEKKLLRKLLVFFKNIKFFPASLNGVPEDQWEIIPTEQGAELKVEKAKEKKNARDPKAQQLKDIADQFAPGSLERKAVEEEIRKYEAGS